LGDPVFNSNHQGGVNVWTEKSGPILQNILHVDPIGFLLEGPIF
jgi:hypothetical protein